MVSANIIILVYILFMINDDDINRGSEIRIALNKNKKRKDDASVSNDEKTIENKDEKMKDEGNTRKRRS